MQKGDSRKISPHVQAPHGRHGLPFLFLPRKSVRLPGEGAGRQQDPLLGKLGANQASNHPAHDVRGPRFESGLSGHRQPLRHGLHGAGQRNGHLHLNAKRTGEKNTSLEDNGCRSIDERRRNFRFNLGFRSTYINQYLAFSTTYFFYRI